MILIHPVDWEKTFAAVREGAEREGREADVLCFGPGSLGGLCGSAKGYTGGVRAVDVGVVPNVLEKVRGGGGDIAIVGMGVKFPKGNDAEELWDTLTKGLNTVAEVR